MAQEIIVLDQDRKAHILQALFLFPIAPKIFVQNPDGTNSAIWLAPSPSVLFDTLSLQGVLTSVELSDLDDGNLMAHRVSIQREVGQTGAELLSIARTRYTKLADPTDGMVASLRKQHTFYGRRFNA